MAITDLLDQAAEAGVIFVLSGNRVGLRGDPTALKEWAPRLRQQRGAVLREVQKRQRVHWQHHEPTIARYQVPVSLARVLSEHHAAVAAEPLENEQ